MKRKQISQQLHLTILLVCCYQQIWAASVNKGTGTKHVLNANNAPIQTTTKQPVKLTYTTKNPNTATTSTNKPDLATTTLYPYVDLDGRSAFINNEFVSDAKETLPHLSNNLKLSNRNGDGRDYNNDSPQIKHTVIDTEKLAAKPSFVYGMEQLEDYEDGEMIEYGLESDCASGNCEDNFESGVGIDEVAEEASQFNHKQETNVFEQSPHSKLHDAVNYKSQINVHPGNKHTEQNTKNIYEPTETTQQLKINKGSDDIKALEGLRSKPNNQYSYNTQNNYGSINGNEQQQQYSANQYMQLRNRNTNDKLKPQHQHKPTHNVKKTQINQKPKRNSQPFSSQHIQQSYNKPGYNHFNKPLYNNNNYYPNSGGILVSTITDDPYNDMEPYGSSSVLLPNYPYETVNTQMSTPFSIKYWRNKKFTTVGSATQYITMPFADLEFKYSIGVAKRTSPRMGNHNFADGNNKAQIFDMTDDMEAKAE